LLWGVFDLFIAVFAFLFLQETRGKSLEKIIHEDLPVGKEYDGQRSGHLPKTTGQVSTIELRSLSLWITTIYMQKQHGHARHSDLCPGTNLRTS